MRKRSGPVNHDGASSVTTDATCDPNSIRRDGAEGNTRLAYAGPMTRLLNLGLVAGGLHARLSGALVIGASVLLFSAPAGARTLHVAVTGTSGADGSAERPFATLAQAVPLLAPGDELVVHAGSYELTQPVEVRVQGTERAPVLLRADGAVTLRDGARTLPDWTGMLQLQSAAWVTLRGFRVENAGFFGIKVEQSEHVVVEDCVTDGSDGSGIYVGRSTDVTVRRCEVSRCCEADKSGANAQECVSIVNTDGFEVERVEVHHSVRGETGGEGIDVKEGSRNGSVHHCRIHDVVRLGLYVDAWDKLTENIELYSNEVYHCDSGIVLASEAGGLVSDVRVHDNVIWENGRQFRPQSTFWPWDGGGGIVIPGYEGNGPRERIAIYNNTVVANAGTTVWGLGIQVDTDNVTDLLIRDNIVSNNAASQLDIATLGTTDITHNLIYPYKGESWTHEVKGAEPIEADPAFVERTAHNFRLTANSPAIDAGLGGAAALDFDGNQRVAGAALDLGAFEYGSQPPAGGTAGAGPNGGESGHGGGGDSNAGNGGNAGALPSAGGATAESASAPADDSCGCGVGPSDAAAPLSVLLAACWWRLRRRAARANSAPLSARARH